LAGLLGSQEIHNIINPVIEIDNNTSNRNGTDTPTPTSINKNWDIRIIKETRPERAQTTHRPPKTVYGYRNIKIY
jgi:hypothetical protein